MSTAMGKGTKNLQGQRFGRLIVTSFAGRRNGNSIWNLKCDCGNEHQSQLSNLMSGTVRSCGCFRRERITTHGESRKKYEYTVWCGIIQRCKNEKCRAYKSYGGRGIYVCERWESYENFLEDMGRSPSRKHSIERIDNNGNYEPLNCKWATTKEQSRNKRNNRLFTFKGVTKCIADWSRHTGIDKNTLSHRLNAGWDIERALTEKPINNRKP